MKPNLATYESARVAVNMYFYWTMKLNIANEGLNGEDGWMLAVIVADRGEPAKNDSINFALWQGRRNLLINL